MALMGAEQEITRIQQQVRDLADEVRDLKRRLDDRDRADGVLPPEPERSNEAMFL